MSEIFDGIQRPLETIYESIEAKSGKKDAAFIPLGVEVENLDHEKKWSFTPRGYEHMPGQVIGRRGETIKVGQTLGPGDVIGAVHENNLFATHKIMIPPHLFGKVVEIGPLMTPKAGE